MTWAHSRARPRHRAARRAGRSPEMCAQAWGRGRAGALSAPGCPRAACPRRHRRESGRAGSSSSGPPTATDDTASRCLSARSIEQIARRVAQLIDTAHAHHGPRYVDAGDLARMLGNHLGSERPRPSPSRGARARWPTRRVGSAKRLGHTADIDEMRASRGYPRDARIRSNTGGSGPPEDGWLSVAYSLRATYLAKMPSSE